MRSGSYWVGVFLVGFACDAPRPVEPRVSAIVADEARVAEGLALIETLRCGRCHAGAPAAPEAARLHEIGARLQLASLAAPHVAHAPGIPLAADEAADLVHFLAGLGGPLIVQPLEVNVDQLEAGRQVYHRVGCVACHEPYEEADNLERPLWEFEDVLSAEVEASAREERDAPFGDLRARTSAAALARYLEDPLAFHPGGAMPSLRLSRAEAEAVAMYLFFELAVDEGFVLEDGVGLAAELYEGRFDSVAFEFEQPEPVRRGSVADLSSLPEHPEDRFGFKFRGFLEIPRDGIYVLATTSDDGSWLYIDGELVVDNGGDHPMTRKEGQLWLAAGRHSIEIVYYENGGDEGLEVSWEGPGFADQPLPAAALSHWRGTLEPPELEPFAIDLRRAERGRERFAEIGCQACHPLPGMRAAPQARPLRAGDWGSRKGCLAERPLAGLPHYDLTAEQRAALSAADQVTTRSAQLEIAPSVLVDAAFERFDCAACHDRAGAGGPAGDKRSYFFVDTNADLGEEGRIPPTLDRVGSKLQENWIHEVLVDAGRVRPYMRTRMPQFGSDNVGTLASALVAADRRPGDDDEPEFSLEAIEAGQRLVGTDGLGCIQCHDFAGHPSIGIPAVDLARVNGRIRPAWFKQLLLDPVALKMNTRMPSFMSDGLSPITDVYDGDPELQADAIWTYLSLGDAMPYPDGLVPSESEYELEPLDGPISCMVFMEGVSPRTVLVGYPERTHVAFDVESSRLAKAWRGRFYNARGTWHERAGALESPPSADVLDFPKGAPFAVLTEPDDPWPVEQGREAGYRARGRRFDESRAPIFLYRFGDLDVQESAVPVLAAGGTSIVRRFSVGVGPLGQKPEGLVFRAAVGTSVETREGGEIVVKGERELRLRIDDMPWYTTRRSDGLVEVRVPVEDFKVVYGDLAPACFEVEVTW